MKYMTFNNACFFTVLANLLEEFNIDVEDRDIIKDSIIPNIFLYDTDTESYLAGYQIQQQKYINQYLQKYHLVFKEKIFELAGEWGIKEALINDLLLRKNCVVSLKVLDSRTTWHATIFKGVINDKYAFLNMKRYKACEPDTYVFSKDELLDVLADDVRYGWIEYTKTGIDSFNLEKEIWDSIEIIKNLQRDIILFCSIDTTYSERQAAKEKLFRPLYISYRTITRIMDDFLLINQIETSLSQYLCTMKIEKSITLSQFIDVNLLNEIFENIINRIIFFIHN